MTMTFPEYESFDGLGLANLIQSGVISPIELLEAAIERIELWNPKLNAVIHKMYDEARSAVKSELPKGLFHGVPILLKDILAEYAGTPISLGSRFAYNNHLISKHDSEIVKRLKASGVLMLGKTNVPEFALSPVTEPELFGPSHNPWNLTRSPGGSSGGAAAAVAARMVPIAHGGDGGGSLRMPAAFSGVFGFKPSRGRTPTGPTFMRVWQGMVVEHALTRSVRDSAAMLDVLSGPELGSPFALPKPEKSFLNGLEKSPAKLRIALIEKPFFQAKLDLEYAGALKKAAWTCEDLGHIVEPAVLKINDDIVKAFVIILFAETSALIKGVSELLGKKPKSNELEKATAMLVHAGNEFSAAEYAWAIRILDTVGRQLAEFTEKYDVILTPTVPFPAPEIGTEKLDRHEQLLVSLLTRLPYVAPLRRLMLNVAAKKLSFMAYTGLFNITGQPAMSVPLYVDQKGMPIGIQFAAGHGRDLLLLQLARQLEEALPWEQRKPVYY